MIFPASTAIMRSWGGSWGVIFIVLGGHFDRFLDAKFDFFIVFGVIFIQFWLTSRSLWLTWGGVHGWSIASSYGVGRGIWVTYGIITLYEERIALTQRTLRCMKSESLSHSVHKRDFN